MISCLTVWEEHKYWSVEEYGERWEELNRKTWHYEIRYHQIQKNHIIREALNFFWKRSMASVLSQLFPCCKIIICLESGSPLTAIDCVRWKCFVIFALTIYMYKMKPMIGWCFVHIQYILVHMHILLSHDKDILVYMLNVQHHC